MRMSSYSMLFGGVSNLDLALVKLQSQAETAIEKAARTSSFADTLAALQSTDALQESATVDETKSTAEIRWTSTRHTWKKKLPRFLSTRTA